MKIYTKTGDDGETGLFGGERVSKSNERVAAYGDVDELNSVIGVARTAELPTEIDGLLHQIQVSLFNLGAELATVPGRALKGFEPLAESQVTHLETAIDDAEKGLPALTTFILPGGSLAASHLHVARTVCRRAERSVVGLSKASEVRPMLVHYLNRLSDLLFTLARKTNHETGVADVPWKPTP